MARVREESANTTHCSENSSQVRLEEKTVDQWVWNSARCSLWDSGDSASCELLRVGAVIDSIGRGGSVGPGVVGELVGVVLAFVW